MSSEEITFLLQGNIDNNEYLHRLIGSVRKFYPESPIILSTWRGNQVECFDVDYVIESADPGPSGPLLNGLNNVNRQTLSTKNGLKCVKTKFVVKSRTDNFFTNSNIVNLIELAELKNELISGFNRIVIPSDLSINPRRKFGLPFHPSDFFLFGRTADLLVYFDTKKFKVDLSYKPNDFGADGNCFDIGTSHSPEQWIFTNFLSRQGISLPWNSPFTSDPEILEKSETHIANCFLLIASKRIGFNNFKYRQNFFTQSNHTYREKDFHFLLKKYCPKLSYSIKKDWYYFLEKPYFLIRNILCKLNRIRFLG